MKALCVQIEELLPQLKPRVISTFSKETDKIDYVAQHEIPPDGPRNLTAVATIGDGNCMCRAASRAYFNDDSHHIEIRARIAIKGVVNMEHYLSDDCLERGATVIHANADLPTVFTTFSEFYTPGQMITPDSIAVIYAMEMHSITKIGTYMGLWQMAQASSVLGIPIHTIYPERGESNLRHDLNRIFFPIEYPDDYADEEPLVAHVDRAFKRVCTCPFRPISAFKFPVSIVINEQFIWILYVSFYIYLQL